MSDEASGGTDVVGTLPGRDMRGLSGIADLLRTANDENDGGEGEAPKKAPAAKAKPADNEPGSGDTNQQIIDGLLADPGEGEGDDDDAAKPGAQTFDGLAATAGISAKDLYQHTVAMGDGREPVTISELKDQALQFQRRSDLGESLDVRQTDFENEMLRARQEFAQLVKLLPGNIPPALLQEAKRMHVASQDAEQTSLLSVKPEWRDPQVYQQAQVDILEAITPYGFKRGDLNKVLDHRWAKLLHDFAGMSKRIAGANARLKELRDTDPTPRKAKKSKSTDRPARQATVPKSAKGNSAKVLGVADILSEAQK